MFDRVFCISVLEHLHDFFTRHAGWRVPGFLRFAFRRDIEQSLREFRRVLTEDGVIVLTFDHPNINLDYLFEVTAGTGLAPPGRSTGTSRPMRSSASRSGCGVSA